MNTKNLGKKGGYRVPILGVGINSTREEEVLSLVVDWIEEFRAKNKGKRLIFTPNPEMLVEADGSSYFKEVLNSADLNIPDGIGIIWANTWLRLSNKIKPDQIISARLTGVDLTQKLLKLALVQGWKVFFIGGQTGVALKAKKAVLKEFGALQIEVDDGPQAGLEPEEWRLRSEESIKKINKFKPDLLFVGFGHGKQESWLIENKASLQFGVGMGVGGVFDFLSGSVARAPKLIRLIGLEWLYRLVQEPWRWRRQLRLGRFIWLAMNN